MNSSWGEIHPKQQAHSANVDADVIVVFGIFGEIKRDEKSLPKTHNYYVR